MADGNNGVELVRTIAPLAAVGGGLYLANKALLGSKQAEIDKYKRTIERASKDFRKEVEEQDQISNAELQTHIAEYRAEAKALNSQLESGKLDLDAWENELQGEGLAAKALGWKQAVINLSEQNLAETTSESQFERIMDDIADVVPWAEPIGLILTIGGTGAILSKLLRWGGGGGGGLALLKSIADFAAEGLFGDNDNVDETSDPAPPAESPTSDPGGDPDTGGEPSVSGSPRGAFQDVGLPLDIGKKIITAIGIGPSVVITLGAQSLEAIADATGKGVDWLVDNPGVAIVLALAIVAAAALAASDGPLPFGDYAGAGVLGAASRATGVALPSAGSVGAYAGRIAI